MSLATISTAVIKETAPKISPKAVCVACVNMVKLMIKVAPEAINLQLIALATLLDGLSLTNDFFLSTAIFYVFRYLTILLNSWKQFFNIFNH